VYHITGLSREQIQDLTARVSVLIKERRGWQGNNFKLGLFKRVVITLVYLRRNHRQVEISEFYGVDQSTVSRYIATLTPLVAEALDEFVPMVEDLDPDVPYVIDGTLLPCWSWSDHPELWSGKHHTTGKNIIIAAYLDGELAWAGDPENGSTHDATSITNSGFVNFAEAGVVADMGFIGTGAYTPRRRLPGQERLSAHDQEFNKSVNRIRWVIERTISWLKNWNILHVDYRRPLHTFDDTISAVIALEFYKNAHAA
jgi:hypothetical protein